MFNVAAVDTSRGDSGVPGTHEDGLVSGCLKQDDVELRRGGPVEHPSANTCHHGFEFSVAAYQSDYPHFGPLVAHEGAGVCGDVVDIGKH